MAEAQQLRVQSRLDQGVLVLTFLDRSIHTDTLAETLRDQLLDAVATTRSSMVVLDFRNVEYLSSAGFRPLLSLRRKLHESGGRLILCNLHPDVANVFRITRLISTSKSAAAPFEQADDLPAALTHLLGNAGTA